MTSYCPCFKKFVIDCLNPLKKHFGEQSYLQRYMENLSQRMKQVDDGDDSRLRTVEVDTIFGAI
jgi:hypothetical protein